MVRLSSLAACVGASVLLAGCTELQETRDQLARRTARATVDEVLVTRFPGVDGTRVTPYTDCIINGASAPELGSFAKAAVTGVTESTVTLVFDIAKRPETAQCLLRAGLAA